MTTSDRTISKQSLFIILIGLLFVGCSKNNFSAAPNKVSTLNCVNCEDPEPTPEPTPEVKTPNPTSTPAPKNTSLVAPGTVEVNEGQPFASIVFQFVTPVVNDQVFNVSIETGDADLNQDFRMPQTMIPVAAGSSEFTVDVPIVDDELWDVDREIFVVLVESADFAAQSAVVIVDNEPFPSIALRETSFDNPQGTQPNAVLFGAAPDQEVYLTLRSDQDAAEAQQNACQTNTAIDHIAIPNNHYRPVGETTVMIPAFSFESTQFNTTWLNVPQGGGHYTICFHVLRVDSEAP